MRFLCDQDVYALTAQFLRDLGHDVATAAELHLSRTADMEILRRARDDSRILVSRDRDFGGLVFVQHVGTGVIYLRITPATLGSVHNEVKRVLEMHSEAELHKAFVVVEPGRHRFRRLASE